MAGKKPKQTERKLQQACVSWWRYQYPKRYRLLFMIPNGVQIPGSPKQRAIAGKRMKDEGMVPGAADLFLSIPSGDYPGLYLEAKVGRNKQSDNQLAFEKDVVAEGYGYAIFKSVDQFISIVQKYLAEGVYD